MRSRAADRPFVALALLVVAAALPAAARAHEVRPAYLELTERPSGAVSVLWKQPAMGDFGVRLVPHLSSGWLERAPSELSATASFLVKRWEDVRAGPQDLSGQRITVEGLEASITDVLVSVNLADGTSSSHVLTPGAPSVVIGGRRAAGIPVPQYTALGFEHILLGFDHLLFVLGLVLLVKGRALVVKTITAFTVAHSLTLTAAALGWVRVDTATVEAVIAASIVFVGVELLRAAEGIRGLTARFPWVVSFSFGLLHGFAFAQALVDVGLPKGAVPLSLFLFNCGVELGQLAFVLVVFAVLGLARRLSVRLPGSLRLVPPYAIASFATFCLVERLARITG